MNKLFILLAVIAVMSIYVYNAQSQTNSNLPDLIDQSIVTIKPSAGSSSGFKLTNTPTTLTSVLGEPKSIDNIHSEQDDKRYDVYTYEDASFYFDADKLVSTSINSSSIIVSFNGQNHIRVGDNISSLQDIFPNSYNLMKDGQLFVNFKTSNGIATDEAILFEYKANGVITNIII
ncbi:hypothetical protein H9Q13_11955 [Pontibacter sp. JH31]|uniref:Uncharacterized protein n=1 Tax=Pontibacter aquaedesilientis TaxID=2766980 RepID=A0ABR7XHZ3_9BACT|nr:hypothetical protein [Pontibacter aquaedesilientis]MBD1397881.1 hypothetical protein [Pontibacter aquaedesilientis]